MRVLLFILMSLLVCRGGADQEVTNAGRGLNLGEDVGFRPAGQTEGPGQINERPRVICGRALADARMIYCFTNSDPQKRNSPSGLMATLYQRSGGPGGAPNLAWQWMAEKHVHALRSKRDYGLADECCLKPCFLSEILSYC